MDELHLLKEENKGLRNRIILYEKSTLRDYEKMTALQLEIKYLRSQLFQMCREKEDYKMDG